MIPLLNSGIGKLSEPRNLLRRNSAACCKPGLARDHAATTLWAQREFQNVRGCQMKLAWILWFASMFHNPIADRTCLATTIYLEARGEPLIGQLAVAEVALRRRDNGGWGNSLCSVLSARHQFALTTTSKNFVIKDVDSWRRDWLIAGMAMLAWHLPADWRPSVVPHADHFFASDTPAPAWAIGPPLAVIGDHSFYRVN